MNDDLKILIPMIRKVLPELVARDIVGVQPMQDSAGDIFKYKTVTYTEDDPPPIPNEGDRRHVFGQGWQIFYGGDWISEHVWLKLKLAGL